MPFSSVSSGGGLVKLFDSTLSAPAASIDSGAGGFATTFDDLYIDILVRTDEVAAFSTIVMTFNNDSGAHYDYSLDRNRNTTVTGAAVTANPNVGFIGAGASINAGFPAVCRATILGYGQTTFFKTGELTYGVAGNAAGAQEVGTIAFSWESTVAISRVKIAVSGGANLIAGSRLLIRAS